MDPEIVKANRYKLFAVGAIGTLMATLDASILNVALPSISNDLHADIDTVAWVILSYSLTLISLMIAFGAWTERRGYSFAYKFGYGFFLVGSVVCALSQSIHLLILGRIIQATGTAMFAAIGPGMVTLVFPREERGKGIGLMVMMVSAGFMIGPPVGGLMLGIWPWQSIFIVNIPIGLIGIYLTVKYFKILPVPTDRRRIPLVAAALIAACLVSFVFALKLISDYPLSDPRVWGLAIISAVCFVFYVREEAIPEQAIIGLDLFRNRQFTASLLAQLMHFIATTGVLVLIPFYFEQVRHLEPKQVGLYLVIIPIFMFIFAPLSGRVSDKIGVRFLTSLGMLTMAGGLVLLSLLQSDSSLAYVAVALGVVGMGNGIFNTPNTSATMGSVSESRRAVASGILATNRNIGMSFGVALSTAMFSYFELRNAGLGDATTIFLSSYRPVIYIAVGVALVGFLLCLIRDNRVKQSH